MKLRRRIPLCCLNVCFEAWRESTEGALTDEVEDDAAVGEPPRGVVEVGPPLRRRDADPHHRRHAARVAVGVAEVEQHHPIPKIQQLRALCS